MHVTRFRVQRLVCDVTKAIFQHAIKVGAPYPSRLQAVPASNRTLKIRKIFYRRNRWEKLNAYD